MKPLFYSLLALLISPLAHADGTAVEVDQPSSLKALTYLITHSSQVKLTGDTTGNESVAEILAGMVLHGSEETVKQTCSVGHVGHKQVLSCFLDLTSRLYGEAVTYELAVKYDGKNLAILGLNKPTVDIGREGP